MVKKTEERKEDSEEKKDIFKAWADSYTAVSKMWEESYLKLYKPWIESTAEMLEKAAELSKEAAPKKYQEFYTIWIETYKETYGKYIQSIVPSKEVFEGFVQSTSIYLTMYKSWIAALEKMVEKTMDLSKQPTDPEASKQYYNLWIKMYEKAFDSFYEDMPLAGPMKEMMEPVKVMAKMYADTFAGMSRMWVKSGVRSASAYPGKYTT